MKKVLHDGRLVVIDERLGDIYTRGLQLCMRAKRSGRMCQIIQKRMITLNLANELVLPAHGGWLDVKGKVDLWSNVAQGDYTIDWTIDMRSSRNYSGQIEDLFTKVCGVLHGFGSWDHKIVTHEQIIEARKSLAKVSGVDGFSPGRPDKEQMALVHSVGIGEIIDNVDMVLDAKDFTLRLTGRDISDAMAEKMYRMIADVYRM